MREVIWRRPISTTFDFLTEEEIRRVSVVCITQAQTFDDLEQPIQKGLYDPAMGPIDRFSTCETCGLSSQMCPGHQGHIELCVPVYNPLLLNYMFRLLRMKCFNCHQLRHDSVTKDLFFKKLELLDRGDIIGAMTLAKKTSSKAMGGNGEDMSDDEDHSDDETRFLHSGDGTNTATPAALHTARRKVIKDFLRAPCPRVCKHCKEIAPTLRKDGYTKIFRIGLSKQMRKKQNQLHYTNAKSNGDKIDDSSASDNDDENDEDQEEADSSRMMPVTEVEKHLKLLWQHERSIMRSMHKVSKTRKRDHRMFFIRSLAVEPNKYRPPAMMGGQKVDHAKNTYYKKIVKLNEEISRLSRESGKAVDDDSDNSDDDSDDDSDDEEAANKNAIAHKEQSLRNWLALIEQVNCLIDSNTAGGSANVPVGIKQGLEKKAGLFRQNMMGKRVNFACRSVVNPDPWIKTSEIGIPMIFAKNLSFPEPVQPYNITKLQQAVINGSKVWPGALSVEDEHGRITHLGKKTPEQRQAIADTLMTGSSSGTLGFPKKVYRHLNDGDVMIVNRQPTLHKASMMCHTVKVLKGAQVIRLHYANCNSYNADFDGDEINCHLPQSNAARAEGYHIANAASQYLTPKDGTPLRGLVQDHVVSGALFTKRDTFFTEEEYHQYLYTCCLDLGLEQRIPTVPPAIIKPRKLWTGKQIVSTLLDLVSILGQAKGAGPRPPITLEGKSQTPSHVWNGGKQGTEEGKVIIRGNRLLTGVIDKAQQGSKTNSIVHAVFELYGADAADALLTAFGRIFSTYLQSHGFTAALEDLLVQDQADANRAAQISLSKTNAVESTAKYSGISDYSSDTHSLADVAASFKAAVQKVKGDEQNADNCIKSSVNECTSATVNHTVPNGLRLPFPKNCFATMFLTGGKGSRVNLAQITCMLGQQELEGRRVPRMASGRTLPSFPPFDPTARAGGYVANRFLTGIKPQEYFFHCMAGREGLVDTAVKTANSGYLQRCIVKHLETAKVAYDGTVRDDDNQVLQFAYGEDALDTTKASYLDNFDFHVDNFEAVTQKLNLGDSRSVSGFTTGTASKYNKKRKKNPTKYSDPVCSKFDPYRHLGACSEIFHDKLDNYVATSDKFQKSKKVDGGKASSSSPGCTASAFRSVMQVKYLRSLVHPGEAVGVIAAQSIGEPSTQMTLNTFHLAGHGGANVTLGIPRMREIIMSASTTIKTPTMEFVFRSDVVDKKLEAGKIKQALGCYKMADIVRHVSVRETVGTSLGMKTRRYVIRQELKKLPHGMTRAQLKKVLGKKLLPALMQAVSKSPGVNKAPAQVVERAKKNASAYKKRTDDEEEEESEQESDQEEDEESEGESSDSESSGAGDEQQSDNAVEADGDAQSQDDNESSDDADDSSRDDDVTFTHGFFGGMRIESASNKVNSSGTLEIVVNVPLTSRKILMVSLVGRVNQKVLVRSTKNIADTFVTEQKVEGGKVPAVQTMGVNFGEIWRFSESLLDLNKIKSNDTGAILRTYGVEAARASIIENVKAVFGAYGIGVSFRHTSLVADYMTFDGGYKPMNRVGMDPAASTFLKMSYETSTGFLREACLTGDVEALESPSARIILGIPCNGGTGAVDLLQPLVHEK